MNATQYEIKFSKSYEKLHESNLVLDRNIVNIVYMKFRKIHEYDRRLYRYYVKSIFLANIHE